MCLLWWIEIGRLRVMCSGRNSPFCRISHENQPSEISPLSSASCYSSGGDGRGVWCGCVCCDVCTAGEDLKMRRCSSGMCQQPKKKEKKPPLKKVGMTMRCKYSTVTGDCSRVTFPVHRVCIAFHEKLGVFVLSEKIEQLFGKLLLQCVSHFNCVDIKQC